MHAMDDRTRTKEEQCLEECMGHHMENGCYISARTNSQEHETKLRDGGIRQHFLNVSLSNSDCCCKERSERTYGGNDIARPRVRSMKHRRHTREKKNTGGHHGGCVDESRNWCWTLHRVGQPQIQRQLCTLAASTNKQHEGNASSSHCS